MKTRSKTNLGICSIVRLAALIGTLLIATTAGAAEIRTVEVEKVDEEYRLVSQVWFDAALAPLYQTFLDFDLHHQFSSFMVDSRNLDTDEQGRPGFYMLNRGCVLFFCRTFERFGYVEAEADVFITASAHAEQSDFHSSVETWEFAVEGEGTLVTYRWSVDPKFWIPPLVGPYAMRRTLEKNSIDALNRIEAIARGESQ